MNKLALGGAISIAVLGVMIFSKGEQPSENYKNDTSYVESNTGVSVSEAEKEVSNSSKETLRTLIRQIDNMKNDLATVKNRNAELESQLDSMNNDQQNSSVDSQLTDALAALQEKTEMLEKKLKERTEEKQQPPSSFDGGEYTPDSKPTDLSGNDIFDDLVPQLMKPAFDLKQPTQKESVVSNTKQSNTSVTTTVSDNNIVWYEQADIKTAINKQGEPIKSYPVTFANHTDMSKSDTDSGNESDLISMQEQKGNDQEKEPAVPMYSIPSNSTLLNARGMTALVGRVPTSGTLTNPYRFKVMLGEKNLATNGHYIPNLKNMVVSGYAQGDFTLECVSGVIDKATFTFNDGTIREIQAQGSSGTGLISQSEGLGWISDSAGVPCIEGEYISNAPEYLSTIGALSGISTLASAISDAQTTVYSDSDSSSTSVTGDTLTYALGEGVSSGVDEMSDWFTERQESAFDAVFLPAGQDLIVHIEQMLEIDYEPDGRKLSYSDNSDVEDYLQW